MLARRGRLRGCTGYEKDSIDEDPEFRSWQPVGTPDDEHDDLVEQPGCANIRTSIR
jgi:hypothetical protein